MSKNKRLRTHLFARRQIALFGRIDRALARSVCSTIALINHLSADPITLFIDSHGGHTASAFQIYDEVLRAGNVDGLILRVASSGAAMILQACRHRKALRNCSEYIFIHNPQVTHEKYKQDKRVCALIATQTHAMHRILSTRSGIPLCDVAHLCKNETKMRIQEALRLGFIDEIVHTL